MSPLVSSRDFTHLVHAQVVTDAVLPALATIAALGRVLTEVVVDCSQRYSTPRITMVHEELVDELRIWGVRFPLMLVVN